MIFRYAVNILDTYRQEDLDSLLKIITYERKTSIDKFLFKLDKIRCLLAEILLRYALRKHYNLNNYEIKFTYNKFGKPYLKNYPDIHFNLSHSGDWILCGIGDVPLGINIEQIQHKNLDLAQSLFTNKEYHYILQQPTEKQVYSFFQLWTLKESYVKAVGKGLNIPFNSFHFERLENKIQLFYNEYNGNSYVFRTELLDMDHCTALCVKSTPKSKINEKIIVLSINQLVEYTLCNL